MAASSAGRVLKDRRTKNLTKRLKPGDIALIHHADLDSTAARALIECEVRGVVNAAQSITARYPNRGPIELVNAGIPLLDQVGDAAFDAVVEGRQGRLIENRLQFEDGASFPGVLLDRAAVEAAMAAASNNLSAELDRFARNTLHYLDNEKEMLVGAIAPPRLRTRFTDRHVMIVVRGEGYKQDLAMLTDYLRDMHPIFLAVDGGADALLDARIRPDVILGDMDSVSDAALRCGAEIVVHGYAEGDARGAPGLERVRTLGLEATVFCCPGTSEDVAMLLADELGAKLIVAVGTHFSLVDFLDKGRGGMASTFLTRLRIGSKLVDAKGIARLWTRQHPRVGEIALILFAAATPIAAALVLSPFGQTVLETLGIWFRARHR
jgi:uncharacterized membrane-anchored protein